MLIPEDRAQKAIAIFSQHVLAYNDLKIQIEPYSNTHGLLQKLRDKNAKPNTSCIIVGDQHYTAELAENKKILPLDHFIDKEKEFLDQFESPFLSHSYWHNEIYSLPLLQQNHLLFYNKSAINQSLDACNNHFPDNWNDFDSLLDNFPTQKDPRVAPLIIPHDFYANVLLGCLSLRNDKVIIDTNKAGSILHFWHKNYQKNNIYIPERAVLTVNNFLAGNANFLCASSSVLSSINLDKHTFNNNFVVANTLTNNYNQTQLNRLNISISSNTPDTLQLPIWNFILSLYSLECQKELCSNTGHIPVTKTLFRNEPFCRAEVQSLYYESFENLAAPQLSFQHREYSKILSILEKNVTDVIKDKISIAQGIQNIEKQLPYVKNKK